MKCNLPLWEIHSGITQNLKFCTSILLLFSFFLSVSAQTIHYVRLGGVGDGSSWVNSSGSLQWSIDQSNAGDEIWVAKGDYQLAMYESYKMKEGVKIYGGFVGNETNLNQRNWKANLTVLIGFSAAIFVNNNGLSSAAVLDGFKLTDAWTGAIVNTNSSPIIRNCIFDDNNAPAISNTQSSPIIYNCIFINNIIGNNAPIISNAYSNPVISNSLFIGNRSSIAVIHSVQGSPTINNCTFYNNQLTGTGGVIHQNAGSVKINNTIIWGNISGNGNTAANTSAGGTISINYTLAQNYNGSGIGNLNINPLFFNISNLSGDDGIYGTEDDGLKLRSESPAIDNGDPLTNINGASVQVGDLDITGNERIQRNRIDIGAYEGGVCISSTESIYVDASVVSSGSGDCWDTAFKTLKEALDFATLNSEIKNVYIAKGTYYPTGIQNGTDRNATFLIPQRGGIEIYGGYPNGGGAREVKTNPTILSGDIGNPNDISDNSYHVMVMTGTSSGANQVVIDGLILTKGNATNGTQFTYNGVLTNQSEGGGLLLRENGNIGDKIIVRNCIIKENVASVAGGLYLWASSALIHHTIISDNSAIASGGGVFIYSTQSPKIVNSLIYNNTAANGGGIYNSNTSTVLNIINVTISDNLASNDGNNIHNNTGATINIVNSIVWGANAAKNILNQAIINASYSDILQVNGVFLGNGNINQNPFFENISEGNYSPLKCSPVINAGNNLVINNAPSDSGTFDLIENSRIYGGTVDMGAYEVQVNPGSTSFTISTPASNIACIGSIFPELEFTSSANSRVCFIVDENVTRTISAPAGAVFSEVIFASYGNASGNCTTGFTMGSCNAVNSRSVIENLALGNNSFIITPNNTTFGDPCSGTAKKLYIQIAYSFPDYDYSWTNDNPAIGLPASGTGSIPSFEALEAGVANITLIASSDACTVSNPVTFKYTVQDYDPIYVDASVSISGNGKSWATAYKTLQEALNVIPTQHCKSDSILVAKGTYQPANGQSFVMIEGVKILGGYPNGGGERDVVNNTTILRGSNRSVIRNDNNGLTTTAVLDGFTITGGTATGSGQLKYGGGIYNRFASPTISNCIFIDNRTDIYADGRGGSIYNYGSSPIIVNCTFTHPRAESDLGGAIHNEYSSTVIVNCEFLKNHAAQHGGAIYNKGGTHTITDCSFVENSANANNNVGSGGAIYNDGATISINGCDFTSNFALQNGGAIYNISSQVVLNNSSFKGNRSEFYGGAIHSDTSSSFSATNCTFEGNESFYSGGAINNTRATLTLNKCIFINNIVRGQGSGGGVNSSNDNTSADIFNSLFVGNQAYIGGGADLTSGSRIVNSTFFGNNTSYLGIGGGINGSSLNITNSIIYGNTSYYTPQVSDNNNINYSNIQGEYGGIGNINTDPQFQNPSNPIGEDGIWFTDDDGFRLQGCSIITDLGNDNAYTTSGGNLETDLDLAGNPRLYGTKIDMGAYESQGETCVIKWIGSPQAGYWSNGSGPGLSDDAYVEGDLNIVNTLQAKDFEVMQGGSVVIQDGGSLTLAGKLTNQNIDDFQTTDTDEQAASFIIKNGGNFIQTIDYNADDNYGKITVERESQGIIRLDYTLWSSPTREQQIHSFSPMTLPNRIYTYETDTSNQNTDGAYVIVPDVNQNFTLGRGYLVRAPNDWDATHNNQEAPYLGRFIGTPFNGTLNVPTYPNGYTSLGNPYPSSIKPENLITQNPGIQTVYFWNNPERIFNPSTGLWEYVGTRYVTCSAVGFSEPQYEGMSIAPGQGFIVYTTAASVNFNNSFRVNSNEIFFRTESESREKHRIWLRLSDIDDKQFNQILIGYMNGGTLGVDNQLDGEFFGYGGSALYNLIEDGKYTIQAREIPFSKNDVVQLGFKAEKKGKFKISLSHFDGLFADGEVMVYLRDNEINIIHNLMESDYKFEAKEGEHHRRFEVIYKKNIQHQLISIKNLANKVEIYKDKSHIVIESSLEKIKSIEIHNHHGKLVYTNSKVYSQTHKISNENFEKGILFMTIQTESGQVISEKVMNN
ncbi:choice-of-anchor Q domain-containing protein [Moheibacter sediminis]|uniref:Galactose binding lectin domain-containing protein n=1 Tax=Moheibacter sediminis TaxID=1434700 RepID=A0A1W2ADL5_9FLAO|nr:choice-of-anchor Q domain-containing protein [Moheibacter sediminis]SMC58582.1 Galactose binding lectin domain-containing protein [Moheibacter sediminis]